MRGCACAGAGRALKFGIRVTFRNGSMLIAAGSEELLLLDRAGNLIERRPWDPHGAGLIDSLGQLESGVVVVKSAGQLWLADAELLNWRRSEGTSETPSWSSPGTTPEALRQALSLNNIAAKA